ncbi:zinc finger protein 768-like [Mytilus edulis]|uniref:zinc finger protein 768-like n=1 Tax=Mytilus edulis TaxID=6550 RepID=UPI0039EFB49D
MIVFAMQLFVGAIEMYNWFNKDPVVDANNNKEEVQAKPMSIPSPEIPHSSRSEPAMKSNNTEGSPKTDDKSAKTDDKSPNTDGKSPKTDGNSPKTDGKSPKNDDKSPNIDDKSQKNDDKSPKTDDKSPKTDDKSPKTDNKSPKTESPKTGNTTNRNNGFGGMKKGFLL